MDLRQVECAAKKKSDQIEDMIFLLFPSALTPYNSERAGSLKKCLG